MRTQTKYLAYAHVGDAHLSSAHASIATCKQTRLYVVAHFELLINKILIPKICNNPIHHFLGRLYFKSFLKGMIKYLNGF